jgi:hypothetical protein
LLLETRIFRPLENDLSVGFSKQSPAGRKPAGD